MSPDVVAAVFVSYTIVSVVSLWEKQLGVGVCEFVARASHV
jgi:hypothetical protein